MKEKKPKKPFMSGYKTYNPEEEGFGDSASWRAAFRERMGVEEAKKTLKDRSPWEVLGISRDASFEEVKRAYRRLVMEHHPDRGGDAEVFKVIQAAYEILESRR